jgi:hypothetical protein
VVIANPFKQQKYYSLAEVRTLLPSKPHISTLHRWMLRGVRGIKLPTILIGGRRFVTDDGLNAFLQQINASHVGTNEATGAVLGTQNLLQAEAFLDREQI